MKYLALILFALLCSPAMARDRHQVYLFKKAHPCPVTGKSTGACRGYVVDHVFPLCGGGPDLATNMQWQSYAASKKKDAREVSYCACLRAHKTACTFKP